MREIKFRAWNKEENKMSEEFSFEDFDGSYFIPKAWYLRNMEVMQFTGLLDKNGKEIYESDVVREANGDIREIVFEDGGFWLKTPNGERYISSQGYREVLGNVFENKDLLTKGIE